MSAVFVASSFSDFLKRGASTDGSVEACIELPGDRLGANLIALKDIKRY